MSSTTTTTLTDMWGNDVEVTNKYISYRNRLIDIHLIQTFQVKGKRLLMNTFKQNCAVPTMCIFFSSKEDADAAYNELKTIWYPKPVELCSSTALSMIAFTLLPPLFLVLLAMFASLDRKN